MNPHYFFMPIDRAFIATKLELNPDFLADPVKFGLAANLQVRSCKRPDQVKETYRNPVFSVDVLRYGGIKLDVYKASRCSRQWKVRIDFNPGHCIYHHNGRVPLASDFIKALALVVKHLSPFLKNPDDWKNLVPGLLPGGPAHWSFLEIMLQVEDPGHVILEGFRNMHYPNMKSPLRHWPTSIQTGATRSDEFYAIYSKPDEMLKKQDLTREEFEKCSGLRLELRLKNEKLVEHVPGSFQTIDGESCLTHFYPEHLAKAHQRAFLQLRGIFKTEAHLTQKQHVPLVEYFIRKAAQMDYNHTASHLIDSCSEDLDFNKRGMIQLLHDVLEQRSKVSREMFSDDVYRRRQISVISSKQEPPKYPDHFTDEDQIKQRQIAELYLPLGHPHRDL